MASQGSLAAEEGQPEIVAQERFSPMLLVMWAASRRQRSHGNGFFPRTY